MLYFCLLILVIIFGYTQGTSSAFVLYKMGGTRESLGYINHQFIDFFVTYFHTFIWIFCWATRIPENTLHYCCTVWKIRHFKHIDSIPITHLDYFLLVCQAYVPKEVHQLDHWGLSDMYLALQRHTGCKGGCMLPGEPRLFLLVFCWDQDDWTSHTF